MFVHGLWSSSATAWASASTTWPDIALSDPALAGYGVYEFDYQTALSSRLFGAGDASKSLSSYIEMDGLLDAGRIVFVCHSQGGIVVRHHLVRMQRDYEERQVAVGLLLVASPSIGSIYASVGSRMWFHAQLSGLSFSQRNKWLNELDADFTDMKEARRFPLFGKELLEEHPTILPRGLLPRAQVVPPWSGARYFAKSRMIANTDHGSIAKPTSRDSEQHRELVHLAQSGPTKIADPARPIPSRLTDGATPTVRVVGSPLAGIVAAVDGPPAADASASEVADFALPLAMGRNLDAMLAAAAVRRHGDAVAICRTVVGRPDFNEGMARAIAPWLRFTVAGSADVADRVYRLRDDVIRVLDLNEADELRMDAILLGCAGLSAGVAVLDWDDEFNVEKASFDHFHAHMRAASLLSHPSLVDGAVRRAVAAAKAREAGSPLHYYDYLGAVRNLPPLHLPAVLSEVAGSGLDRFVLAVLTRACLAPNERAIPGLRALLGHADGDLGRRALLAIAFTPARGDGQAAEKRRLLATRDATHAVAAATEGWKEWKLAHDLVLRSSDPHDRVDAAWALGRMAGTEPKARALLLDASKRVDEPTVRAMLLSALAKLRVDGIGPLVDEQWPTAMHADRFLLAAAKAHLGDGRELLAEFNRPMTHPLIMAVTIQRAVSDAMDHVGRMSPLVAEVLSVGDWR